MEAEFEHHGLSTPYFSLEGLKIYARVVDIIDGDTIVVVCKLYDRFHKFKVRLNGIDTCEMTSENAVNKALALKAKARLANEICNFAIDENTTHFDIRQKLDKGVYIVQMNCSKLDKYGRLLADVYPKESNRSLSQILLDEHLAYQYSGKRKLSEDEQRHYLCKK